MREKFLLAGGKTENGIPAGNVYDKYSARNVLVRYIMKNFTAALTYLVHKAAPASIHEVGCGEGYWVLRWLKEGLQARGSDFSQCALELARANAKQAGVDPNGVFSIRDVYELDSMDAADLVVCCEVLEHLERPECALERLHAITQRYLICSVPREPLWRILNMLRGKYWNDAGNTPGHIQHWSTSSFLDLLSCRFRVQEVLTPIPWTMVLLEPR